MNKKLLLATTAFAGLAHLGATNASAAEWNVTVGGFMEQWFGYGDSSLANAAGFDQQSDTEIHFKPTITLDNGIKIGAMVQLEGQTDADQIDQQFAYIEGSFGRVILGSENSAPMLMALGVPSAGAGLDSGDLPSWIGGVNGDLITTTFNFSRDEDSAQKITYFTPRFYGLQLGASYVPELAEDIDAPHNNINGVRDDAFGFGANYDRSFGDFAFGSSAGYMDYGDDDAAVGDNPTNVGVGISLGYGGLSLGAAYNDLKDSVSGNIESYGVGGVHASGPVSVSLGYIYGEDDGASTESDAFEFGVSYDLGPGFSAVGSVFYAEQETAGVEVDGVAVVGGLSLSF